MSTDSVIPGCLTHYNEQHIQVRKDFMDICAYDKDQYNTGTRRSGKTKRDEPNQECMAKILRLLETLTDRKRTSVYLRIQNASRNKKAQPIQAPSEYRIELTYTTIAHLLYNTYGESTIRNSVTALIQMNYIKRYQKSKNAVPEYVLNIEVIQSLLARNQVVKVTTEETEVLNTTSEGVNSTSDEVLHSTAQGVNSTPNKKEDKNGSNKINGKKESTPTHSTFFSSKQKLMDDLYHHHYPSITLKQTEKLKGDYDKVGLYVETQEDMNSLIAYAEERIAGNDPQAYPGNLARWADSWNVWRQKNKQAESLPWSQPDNVSAADSAADTEMEQAIHREHTPLPVDMQEWMIETAQEFGGDEPACVNELEWCFQHTSCTEEEFYSKLIHAYEKASREKSIDIFFAELKQDLLLVVEAMVM